MRGSKVLQMINDGRIEELKAMLQDEIYTDSLKTKPGEKKRYMAMKKYFNYRGNATRECLCKPGAVKFEDQDYISFTNSWSLILTTEDCGGIELFDESKGNYPDVVKLIHFDGIKKKIDFNKVIAEAKSKGYKLTKSEVGAGFKYLMLYDGTYYKIGLIDISFNIINDGNEIMTYHPDGERMPLTMKNDIGICMIMPVKFSTEPDVDYVIIEV